MAGEEREKLRGVHELLVEAGPPAELSAALKDAPRPGDVRVLRKASVSRKIALLAAAILVVGVAFSLGVATGSRSAASPKTLKTLALSGTKVAPHAHATLDVQQEVAGNWPMTLSVSGLPKATAPVYYEVWLVRNGKPWAPCGEFVVSRPSESLTLKLTAPYSLERGDSWVVTRHTYGQSGTGPTVLQPA